MENIFFLESKDTAAVGGTCEAQRKDLKLSLQWVMRSVNTKVDDEENDTELAALMRSLSRYEYLLGCVEAIRDSLNKEQ